MRRFINNLHDHQPSLWRTGRGCWKKWRDQLLGREAVRAGKHGQAAASSQVSTYDHWCCLETGVFSTASHGVPGCPAITLVSSESRAALKMPVWRWLNDGYRLWSIEDCGPLAS